MSAHTDRAETPDSTVGVIVLEHVLWCAKQNMTPANIFKALHGSAPKFPTWARTVQACIVEINAIRRRQKRRILDEAVQ